MNAEIKVAFKPEIQPLGPSQLETLKPYRVVSVKDGFMEASEGDIVLRFPSQTGGHFIFNCTRQMMFFDRSQYDDWNTKFRCKRAFDVQQIYFAVDHEDRP